MRFYKLVETFDKFLLGGLSETASSEMLYHCIHIRHVMRAESHFQSITVYFWNRHGHVISAVEVSDYSACKILICTVIRGCKHIDGSERSELVM